MRISLLVAACVLLIGAPIFAHHSVTMEFDAGKPVTLKGTVTRIEWRSPHTYFYIDVTDDSGHVDNWACETAGPTVLEARGWNRNFLKVGDHITVLGYPAKDGVKVASARTVLLADGRKMFAGSANDGAPKP